MFDIGNASDVEFRRPACFHAAGPQITPLAIRSQTLLGFSSSLQYVDFTQSVILLDFQMERRRVPPDYAMVSD